MNEPHQGIRQDTSDERLCERVAAGDETAFDVLVDRHQGRAYRLAWSLLRDAEEARDLSQEAFLRVYRSAGRFRGEARFGTWFYRILVNLCLDHRRRRRWWGVADAHDGDARALAEAQPATDPAPEDRLSEEQTMSMLWKTVQRLPPRQRAAIVLQVQEQLSTAEIATVLGCSQATVRVHLHRALMALRKTLHP